MESLEVQLEHLQSYFEQGCTVYRHATGLERISTLEEIDRTLDEANKIRLELASIAIQM